MGQDNQAKVRQLRREESKKKIDAYDRILIVTEGKKTEPNYFQEIKFFYKLSSANVQCRYSELEP